MVAKAASDLRKPDGLVVVPPGTEAAFLAPLPVRRLWGVGPKMEEELLRLGITTIGALAAADPSRLSRRLGTHGHDLQELARGHDERAVHKEHEDAKSIGQEHTFDTDTSDRTRVRRTLLQLADAVARRVRDHGWKARTITLKYRDEDFKTVTRAETVRDATDSGDAMFAVAARLFEGVHGTRRVRLLGVYASGFAGAQPGLFGDDSAPRDLLRDAVEQKFGEGSLTRASLLPLAGARRSDAAPAPDETGGGSVGDRRGSRRLRR